MIARLISSTTCRPSPCHFLQSQSPQPANSYRPVLPLPISPHNSFPLHTHPFFLTPPFSHSRIHTPSPQHRSPSPRYPIGRRPLRRIRAAAKRVTPSVGAGGRERHRLGRDGIAYDRVRVVVGQQHAPAVGTRVEREAVGFEVGEVFVRVAVWV